MFVSISVHCKSVYFHGCQYVSHVQAQVLIIHEGTL